jgi:serine protease Do
MFASRVLQPAPARVRAALFCLVGFLAGGASAARAQQPPELPPEDLQKAEELRQDMRRMMALARDRVFPALVNIEVITVNYWDGKERKGRAVGSGTIISPEGYVLTNYHVAENGKKFKCTLSDKQEITATLVGDDPLTDLAVLKLDLTQLKDATMPLPYASLGDSDELQIGDTVMAMGSPWALSRSVTRGSISNTERVLAASDDEAGELYFDEDQRTGIFNRWIQHDAAVNPGNSGGPLVNLEGEMVGVNARGSLLGGDMGFAIPSNIARGVAANLVKHADVPRSSYGLSLKSIKKTGLKEGVLVNSVTENGPADQAGIKAGDVILKIDDEPVTIWYPEQIPPLLKELADRGVGSHVRITYVRDEQTHETEIVTVRLKRDRGDEAAFRTWGMSAKEITERMAHNRRLDSTAGVLVSGVRSGSPAELAKPAIMEGDVIRAIDGEVIDTLDDFIDCYEEIMDREELPDYLLVEFDRKGKSHITPLKPKPDKDEDSPREVAKAWIGVATQPVLKKLAEQLGHPDLLGFRVTRVYPGSVAADSELMVGDIILELNGEAVEPRTIADAGLFQRRVRRLDIGDDATLTVLRHGDRLPVTLELERTRITKDEARRDRNRDFELTVREVTFFDRDENRWDKNIRGVLIESVESAGWTSLGGLRRGDLIQQIADHEIRGIKSYRRAMEAVTEEQPERVVFVVLRGVRTHFQFVEPDWKPSTGADEDEEGHEEPDAEE